MNTAQDFSQANTHHRLAASGKRRILIVDDQQTILLFLRDKLEELGFKVSLTSNVLEGMRLLDQLPFHGILLNFEMSGLDGLNLLRRLRKQYTTIPVIVMSSKTSGNAIMKAIEAGANDYITKPIAIKTLQCKCASIFS